MGVFECDETIHFHLLTMVFSKHVTVRFLIRDRKFGRILRLLMALNLGGFGLGADDLVINYGFMPKVERNDAHVLDIHRESDGGLWIVGGFDYFEGELSSGVIKLDAAGRVDESFAVTELNLGVIAEFLPLADGSVLVAGYEFFLDGESIGSLVKLDAQGKVDRSFGFPIESGQIAAMVIGTTGNILVGGYRLTARNSSGGSR